MTNTHKTTLHRSILVAVSILTLGTMGACAQSKTLMVANGATRAKVASTDTAQTVLLEPLQAMLVKMKKLQPTGDPDFDFGFQAKVYNEGIRNLLTKEVQSGKDEATRQVAQAALANAKAEEATINDILRQLKPARPNQTFTQQQNKNIDAINAKLQQASTGDSLSSNIDKNFRMLFADQRQAAVDLVTTYLQFGRSASLRTYAEGLSEKAKSEMAKVKAMTE